MSSNPYDAFFINNFNFQDLFLSFPNALSTENKGVLLPFHGSFLMKTLLTASEIVRHSAGSLPPRLLFPCLLGLSLCDLCSPLGCGGESLTIWVLGWRGAEGPAFCFTPA